MRDAGILQICKLQNTAAPGYMPKEQLVTMMSSYYTERSIGVTRAYSALSANQRIDLLVLCYNIDLPIEADYVVLENGEQFRISLKQKEGDNVLLTLERLEDYLDVIAEQT